MLILVTKAGEQFDLSGGKINLEESFRIDTSGNVVIGRHDSVEEVIPVLFFQGFDQEFPGERDLFHYQNN
jgi:hypothetical protein